jgi:hypothetical protein
MANKKIILDPSQWILNANNEVAFRYRVITDDLNIRSAFSPVYSVQVPAIEDIMTVSSTISVDTVGSDKVMRLVWSTTPQYEGMQYYVFLKKPSDTDYVFLKSTSETSFAFIAPNSAIGQYNFIVTLPNTTKTPLTNTIVFSKTTTI